jgi:hypothetical protein
LPDKASAKYKVGQLLDHETSRVLEKTKRKVNGANVAAVITVAIVGGGLSYLLAWWAVSSETLTLSIFAWVLFAAIAIFTIGVSAAGLADLYEDESEKKG